MGEKPILYNFNISPAARAVQIVAKIIDLDLEIRDIDLMNGEQMEDWYCKINPQHTVPTLDDNGDIIGESAAIVTYLVDKYADDDSLYPKDLYLRAKCNQRMFYYICTLFPPTVAILHNVMRGASEISSDIKTCSQKLNFLEAFLADDPFVVGENLTVADIALATTASVSVPLGTLTEEDHPKTLAWLERVKEKVPFFDEMNEPYVQQFNEYVTATLTKNKESEQI